MQNYSVLQTKAVRLRNYREAAAIFRSGWFQNPCRNEGDESLVTILFFCKTVVKELLSPLSAHVLEAFVEALANEDLEGAYEAVTAAARKTPKDCAAFFEKRDPGWTWRFEFFVDCWPES